MRAALLSFLARIHSTHMQMFGLNLFPTPKLATQKVPRRREHLPATWSVGIRRRRQCHSADCIAWLQLLSRMEQQDTKTIDRILRTP